MIAIQNKDEKSEKARKKFSMCKKNTKLKKEKIEKNHKRKK
jgi:hypothetical protein